MVKVRLLLHHHHQPIKEQLLFCPAHDEGGPTDPHPQFTSDNSFPPWSRHSCSSGVVDTLVDRVELIGEAGREHWTG